MTQRNKEKSSGRSKALTVVGAILCIILVPILVINITLIVKSYTNTDEVPKVGGYCPLIVQSGSMEPEIKVGDIIICKQIDPEQVKQGDVIAFFDPVSTSGSVLTHRVVNTIEEGGALFFRTQGDANNAADDALVPAENLVGIYQFRIAGAGNVAMFMQTTTGLIVFVLLPLVLLIAYDVIRRKRYEKQYQQDTDALFKELEELKAQKAAQQNSPSEAVQSENPTDSL